MSENEDVISIKANKFIDAVCTVVNCIDFLDLESALKLRDMIAFKVKCRERNTNSTPFPKNIEHTSNHFANIAADQRGRLEIGTQEILECFYGNGKENCENSTRSYMDIKCGSDCEDVDKLEKKNNERKYETTEVFLNGGVSITLQNRIDKKE